MKLVITPYEMRIVTETVQDVCYLKNQGYLGINDDIHLKISVTRVWNQHSDVQEAAEISVKWEEALCGCQMGGDNPDERREHIQHLEGPRYARKAKVDTCKAQTTPISAITQPPGVEDHEREFKQNRSE